MKCGLKLPNFVYIFVWSGIALYNIFFLPFFFGMTKRDYNILLTRSDTKPEITNLENDFSKKNRKLVSHCFDVSALHVQSHNKQ